MKIEPLDQAIFPDPLRRRLLLGVPGGPMLGSPLALIGCGGGSSSGSEAEGSGVDLHDAGRAFVGDGSLSNVTVGVSLPAGVSVPGGALAAHTVIGGFGVFGAPMFDADLGRQWVVGVGASPAAATFANTTATALAADLSRVASDAPRIVATVTLAP